MELSKILNIFYRYIWLIMLAILVSSLTTFFLFNQQQDSYKATTQLLVGPGLDSPSPDLNSLKIGGQLIQTYAELAGTRKFFEAVNNKLEEKIDPDSLDGMISTRQNTETRILTIVVYNSSKKQAIAIANAAADTLIELSPSKDNTTALLRSQMRDQSHQLEEIVSKAEASIQQLEGELTKLKNTVLTSPEAVKANLDQQNLIVKQLSDEHSRLSDALRTLATVYQILLDTNTNQLQIIEPAVNTVPVAQNLFLRVATSALMGLAFALLIIFVVEFFDERIRFPRDFSNAAGVPLLSAIDKHNRLAGTGHDLFVTLAEPNSKSANSYREAVAKMLYSIGKATHHIFMLSSVGSHSGSDAAVITGNLAIALAKAGNRVALLDAQFHNPVLTKAFQAENNEGLVDTLASGLLKPHLIPVDVVPGLRFLPVGLSPEMGSDAMVNPTKIAKLLDAIQKEVDIVLVASSPIPWFAESLTLASRANAVILVARNGEAHFKTLTKVTENLHEMKIPLAGVVFDYNSSPFSSGERENVSVLARLVSKVASLKILKVPDRLRKSTISDQPAKS